MGLVHLNRCVKRVSKKQKQETASALSNGHSSSDGVQPERQSEDEVSAVDDATAKAKPASSSLLHSQGKLTAPGAIKLLLAKTSHSTTALVQGLCCSLKTGKVTKFEADSKPGKVIGFSMMV